ncbi:MAG: hypothetical protein E7500_03685 [Ruminococcus sp.]|nr:hypothetical protein [Ruminococcus sp.]
MSKKSKKEKNKIIYKSKGIVKYGSDKYVFVAIFLYTLLPFFMIPKFDHNEIPEICILFSIISLPALVANLFMFGFCVKYDISERKLEYRFMFEKFKTIHFTDIRKIYKKSDPYTTFLVIQTDKRKLKINLSSCNGSAELKLFLKRHLPKLFIDNY